MLRLLHTADVHLGARHTDLGERAAVLRERQFTAFRVTIDLAVVEKVDLVLIAGDLFDSNTQPRRSVERVAAELGRLAKASIRTVIIPGTHDVYDGASIYRSYDLAAMARTTPEWIAVLTPEQPNVWLPSLDAVVHGRVFNTKRAPKSPLDGFDARMDRRATWRIGMVHGALAIPGKTDSDEVVFTEEEIARTGLDYLALGHWHSAIEGVAGNVTYAYSGAPEPVAVDQDGAGQVLLVTLDDRGGRHRVGIEPKRVGQTRSEKLELDVSAIASQPILVDTIGRHADSNLVLDVRLTGLLPDTLDVELDEVERALAPSFLRLRIRDMSIPALPEGTAPPPDTVIGAFVRNVETRIAELEKAGAGTGPGPGAPAAIGTAIDGGEPRASTGTPAQSPAEELADLREVLRLGRHLLEGREVTL
ncbi:MAG: DNA repair exonuclease [Candidatus Limnocylindrales bacterium]|jgi:DNA repair exonuclease SbcCD nuclease subunit